MSQVALEHVSKFFRGPKGESIRALGDVGFTVEDKELLVLVGPSGCGKTTTLRLIAGLEDVTSGSIFIDGKVVNDVPPKDRDVAMVFQNHALYPHMSVIDNLAFGLKVRKLPNAEIERRVKAASDMLDLGACLSRRPEELSGGQRQRVAVGRTLVQQPKLFLFDEPLSNLDLQMRSELRTELARLHGQLGATMIYVTHDQTEALTLGDRIAVLRDGKIQQIAEPLRLYREPANLFVAGFIGSPPMNFFRGTISRSGESLCFEQADGNAGAAPLKLKLAPSSPAGLNNHTDRQLVLGLRPEDIHLSTPEGNSGSGCMVEAVVDVVEPLGSETHLHCSCNGHRFVVRAAPFVHRRVNERLTLFFDMTRARFFDAASGNAIG